MGKVLENDIILISAVNYVKTICKYGIDEDLGKLKALKFLVELNENRRVNELTYHPDIFNDTEITNHDREYYYKIIEVKTW